MKRMIRVKTTRYLLREPVRSAKPKHRPTKTPVSHPVSGSGAVLSTAPSASASTFANVTMYCSTGSRNAAGRWPQVGDVATMDRSIPFGTRVHIEGLGDYVVEDRIGYGSDFDIYGGSGDCEARATAFGRHYLRVTVYD